MAVTQTATQSSYLEFNEHWYRQILKRSDNQLISSKFAKLHSVPDASETKSAKVTVLKVKPVYTADKTASANICMVVNHTCSVDTVSNHKTTGLRKYTTK